MDNKKIRDSLKELTERFRSGYCSAAKSSWEHHVKTLPIGQAVPPKGEIYGTENKAAFDELCRDITAQGRDIIGGVKAEVSEMMTAAPTEEAVNTINMLKLRDNVSEDEFARVMEKYGSDNYQAAKAISHVAHEQGIRGLVGCDAALDEYMADLNGLEHSFGPNHFSTKQAEQGATEGMLSLLDAQIDAVFPDE